MVLLLSQVNFDRFANRSTALVPVALLFLWILILRPIYLLYFHPLSKFPGPKFWAITRWGVSRAIISGKSHEIILNLHKKYGPIVRIAPNELAFQSVSAWNDIGGTRKIGKPEMTKEPVFNEAFKDNVVGARKREDHARMRRILSHGFSASTMQKQEPFIKNYIDKLISELYKRCDDGKTLINIEAWYSFTAFDIIGDLSFGESFAPKGFGRRVRENRQLIDEKIAKRRALGAIRPDFMSAMLGNDEKGRSLSDVEITSNCTALILGGADSLSTALSGTTYYLAMNPSTLANTVAEVRSAFLREEDITLTGTGHLKYLNAVIKEALRMFPVFAGASPRQVPAGGAVIAGEFVPENTIVGIWHWSMSRCPDFFLHADVFHCERWLGHPLFKNDKKEAAQPFAVGPRNCIGMNLAYVELRLIIARILWNFELKLDESCKNWVDDMVEYFAWEKIPLQVSLTPRQK